MGTLAAPVSDTRPASSSNACSALPSEALPPPSSHTSTNALVDSFAKPPADTPPAPNPVTLSAPRETAEGDDTRPTNLARRARGLENRGGLCWMNAGLQAVTAIPELVKRCQECWEWAQAIREGEENNDIEPVQLENHPLIPHETQMNDDQQSTYMNLLIEAHKTKETWIFWKLVKFVVMEAEGKEKNTWRTAHYGMDDIITSYALLNDVNVKCDKCPFSKDSPPCRHRHLGSQSTERVIELFLNLGRYESRAQRELESRERILLSLRQFRVSAKCPSHWIQRQDIANIFDLPQRSYQTCLQCGTQTCSFSMVNKLDEAGMGVEETKQHCSYCNPVSRGAARDPENPFNNIPNTQGLQTPCIMTTQFESRDLTKSAGNTLLYGLVPGHSKHQHPPLYCFLNDFAFNSDNNRVYKLVSLVVNTGAHYVAHRIDHTENGITCVTCNDKRIDISDTDNGPDAIARLIGQNTCEFAFYAADEQVRRDESYIEEHEGSHIRMLSDEEYFMWLSNINSSLNNNQLFRTLDYALQDERRSSVRGHHSSNAQNDVVILEGRSSRGDQRSVRPREEREGVPTGKKCEKRLDDDVLILQRQTELQKLLSEYSHGPRDGPSLTRSERGRGQSQRDFSYPDTRRGRSERESGYPDYASIGQDRSEGGRGRFERSSPDSSNEVGESGQRTLPGFSLPSLREKSRGATERRPLYYLSPPSRPSEDTRPSLQVPPLPAAPAAPPAQPAAPAAGAAAPPARPAAPPPPPPPAQSAAQSAPSQPSRIPDNLLADIRNRQHNLKKVDNQPPKKGSEQGGILLSEAAQRKLKRIQEAHGIISQDDGSRVAEDEWTSDARFDARFYGLG